MGKAARNAGTPIVTGDTKVVERGSADGVFINTTGMGLIRDGVRLSAANARPGDAVILSGFLGDHGIAIMAQREGLEFGCRLCSDSAPLHTLVDAMFSVTSEIHAMRDPTRGGLASTLNEIAAASNAGILIRDESVPIRAEVRGACEMLGLDPYYVANEGKLVAIVPPESADSILDAMRAHPLGAEAAIIGTVTLEHPGRVVAKTPYGTNRVVDMLAGAQLPRIC
jgi:hydrogenase expression/formation protein HypE